MGQELHPLLELDFLLVGDPYGAVLSLQIEDIRHLDLYPGRGRVLFDLQPRALLVQLPELLLVDLYHHPDLGLGRRCRLVHHVPLTPYFCEYARDAEVSSLRIHWPVTTALSSSWLRPPTSSRQLT